MFAELALTALAIEAAFGFPDILYRRIGHPVGWIGALIARCDLAWNRPTFSFSRRRGLGLATLLLLLAVSGLAGTVIFLLAHHFLAGFAGTLVCGAVASTLLAQRSLDAHVRAVADALEQKGIEAGRRAVSMIVGRDTASLDEAGVSRAAIESLAENFSDGVVAPLFWLLVAGLPGVFSYKAINTADSMIGHKSDRYLAFGWASARADDLVNLPASRLSALWLVLASVRWPRDSLRAGYSPGSQAIPDRLRHSICGCHGPRRCYGVALRLGVRASSRRRSQSMCRSMWSASRSRVTSTSVS